VPAHQRSRMQQGARAQATLAVILN
jgi:hypothetical protein